MFSVRNLVFLVIPFFLACSPHSTGTDQPADPGAASEDTAAVIKVHGPLQVVVVDDEAFSKVVQREWIAQNEYEIAIRDDSEADFLKRLRDDPASLHADVIIGPSRLLGELAETQLLRALPPHLTSTSTAEAVAAYNLGDVYRAVARKEMRWEQRQLAVSLGAPIPLLLVRSDLVSQVPQTWAELEAFVRGPGQQLPEGVRALAEPNADGWAARMFLSRSASYLYQDSRVSEFFDYSNMQPRITLEPCVRALQEMVAVYDPKNQHLDARETYKSFLSGDVAIALTWPHRTEDEQAESVPPSFPITIQELPGSTDEYDFRQRRWQALRDPESVRRIVVLGHEGRMGVICRRGRNFSLAGVFLGWLGSAEQGPRVCARSRSSAPIRKSQRSDGAAWCGNQLTPQTAAQYAECLDSSLGRPAAFVSLRLPAQDRYMQVLNDAVNRALRGEVKPDVALQRASEAWEDITNELGRMEQIEAYRHSLGIDVE